MFKKIAIYCLTSITIFINNFSWTTNTAYSQETISYTNNEQNFTPLEAFMYIFEPIKAVLPNDMINKFDNTPVDLDALLTILDSISLFSAPQNVDHNDLSIDATLFFQALDDSISRFNSCCTGNEIKTDFYKQHQNNMQTFSISLPHQYLTYILYNSLYNSILWCATKGINVTLYQRSPQFLAFTQQVKKFFESIRELQQQNCLYANYLLNHNKKPCTMNFSQENIPNNKIVTPICSTTIKLKQQLPITTEQLTILNNSVIAQTPNQEILKPNNQNSNSQQTIAVTKTQTPIEPVPKQEPSPTISNHIQLPDIKQHTHITASIATYLGASTVLLIYNLLRKYYYHKQFFHLTQTCVLKELIAGSCGLVATQILLWHLKLD